MNALQYSGFCYIHCVAHFSSFHKIVWKTLGRKKGGKIHRIDCSFSYFMVFEVKVCLFFNRLFITVMHN